MAGGHRIVVVSRVLIQIAAYDVFRVMRMYFVRIGWGIGIYPQMPQSVRGNRMPLTL
jgi:hypothetical protein